MKNYLKEILFALPLTAGIIVTLTALCFLMMFIDYGYDFEESYFWVFVLLFVLGFPTILFGINRYSNKGT